jgi:hypothetical protein
MSGLPIQAVINWQVHIYRYKLMPTNVYLTHAEITNGTNPVKESGPKYMLPTVMIWNQVNSQTLQVSTTDKANYPFTTITASLSFTPSLHEVYKTNA